ncbi:MAG: hypothetical protein D3925_07415 [Candidatus Electrothrix sp. AR5]|nr:hypothetical protein [Candidatus Electrothrix sp. AR5]
MENNMLKKPLIQSALILALPSLLLYLIASSPEATVWSSLGMIALGGLRTIQWIIAMALALLICLAFLFAIFFGAVALFDRETSARMYGNLKHTCSAGYSRS